MDKFKLKSGKPIEILDVGYIHQPLIMEIEEIGFENYSKMIQPFLIPFEEFIPDELSNKIKTFDIFFYLLSRKDELTRNGGIQSFNNLISACAFFFRDKVQYDLKNEFILIGEDGIINRDNFDEIKNIILQINLINAKQRPKLPKKLSKTQQAIHDKLTQHRKRHDEDNINIEDIIDFVMYGGNSFVPYSVVETMTYCQLNTAFNIINIKNTWQEYLLYKTSEKFDVQEDMKNILANIKLYNKNIK